MRKLPSRRDLAALQQSDLEQFKLLLASIKRMCASDLQATTAMGGFPENTLEKRFQKARMLYLQMILYHNRLYRFFSSAYRAYCTIFN